MKSKTHPISKNSPAAIADTLAIGHSPTSLLSPQDEALFAAFQSNLLSLISHELRTPLTGVLNSLGVLEEALSSENQSFRGLSVPELVQMAKNNAQRLQHSLVALLDLAAIESGNFHVRLREVNFLTLVRSRIENAQKLFKELKIVLSVADAAIPILADPQKLGQAVDLCFQILASRAKPSGEIKVGGSSFQLIMECAITDTALKTWEASWTQSRVALQSGMASPYSAFGGVVQSEQAFLSRQEEGLGSEFLLVHEILRLHQGKFEAEITQEGKAILRIDLPQLTNEEGLKTVLTSRAYSVSTEIGSVALVFIQMSKSQSSDDSLPKLREKIREYLPKSTDAVYHLDSRNQLALVLDHCKKKEIEGFVKRLKRFKLSGVMGLSYSHCPEDTLDPGALLEVAGERLR